MAVRKDYFGEDDRDGDGPALKMTTDMERRFVLGLVSGKAPKIAAVEAGYSGDFNVVAWRLRRRPNVIAAIQEEMGKRLATSGVLGIKVLEEIAGNREHKDQLKAARELIAHAGLAPAMEQKITVEHKTVTAEQVRAEIKLLMSRIPEAPRLLEAAGIMDAEFVEVGD